MLKKFPNALAVIIGFVLLAGILTFILPTGSFERVVDPETQREVVVKDSFTHVESENLTVFDILLAIPEGMIGRADLIVLILLLGGCFVVIERTGALAEGIDFLASRVQGKESLAISGLSGIFVTAGVIAGMQEEIIGMVPVLLLLGRKLNYDAFTMIGASYGAAVVGSSFSPINPFGVVVAQDLAELPFLSGSAFRMIVLFLAFLVWTAMILRYGRRNRTSSTMDEAEQEILENAGIRPRNLLILIMIPLAFVLLVYGMLELGWGFNEISAEFFVVGIVAGLIGGLGINGTSEAYIEGFRDMTFACVVIGMANSISLVLKDGMIIDTIVHGLFTPLQYLPGELSAVGMMIAHSFLHFPVPSYSGQAILTMPILIPLSDLLDISRQVCVLAYQYGAITMDLIIPTNGALMAVIAVAGISYDDWVKFITKKLLVILALSALAIIVASQINLH